MKITLLVLLMFALVFAAFAEDAKVLPAGVIRVYVVPSYIFGSQKFDADGDKVDNFTSLGATGAYSFFNLGGAVEYGVNDWITAAAQWAPGVNLSSDFADQAKQSANGPFELFVGAKLQFVGEKGLSQNDSIRFAVAPGVMIPMAFSYDATEEVTNLLGSKDYNVAPAIGAFGLGARFYADYIVNKMFFVNIYAEYIKYLEKDASADFSAELQRLHPSTLTTYDTVNYGYNLTTEVEFNFTKPIAEGLSLSAGLPFGYEYSPEVVYDDVDPDSDDASYTVSVNPNASLFVTSLPLPLEFKASYWYPLMGQNALAKNVVTFQIKAYMKF